jgi:GNAT superfamily N-acetyltransferase
VRVPRTLPPARRHDVAWQIRRAFPGEAGSLAALWLRSRAASAPSIPPTIHTDAEVQRWFEEVVLSNCEVWVVDSAGEAAALMVLDHEWIDQLYVDPASARQGIGGALLDHAKRQRPSELKLWTFQSNLNARRFYEERGFVAIATTPGDNEEKEPDVCYRWRPTMTVTPS